MIVFFEQLLYRFSEAILMPVLMVVTALIAWTAITLGGLLREWLGRRNVRSTLLKMRRLAKSGKATEAELIQCLGECRSGLPALLGTKLREWPAPADRSKCLDELELEVAASLARLGWVTRIAPMLGLMGTLIPLGPALTALAAGDIARLSSNLVVAFTTTVVGVFLGSATFSMSLLRKTWYSRDMSDLEHLFTQSARHATQDS